MSIFAVSTKPRCWCAPRASISTGRAQNLVLHFMASLHFPPLRTYSTEPLDTARVQLPEGALWIEALDYDSLALGFESHRATLSYDGLTRGEIRAHGFVGGLGLGQGFGVTPGDRVTYRFTLPHAVPDAVLVWRYRMTEQATLPIALSGLTAQALTLTGTGDLTTRAIPVGDLPAGEVSLVLETQGQESLQLDGFAVVAQADVPHAAFRAGAPRSRSGIAPRPARRHAGVAVRARPGRLRAGVGRAHGRAGHFPGARVLLRRSGYHAATQSPRARAGAALRSGRGTLHQRLHPPDFPGTGRGTRFLRLDLHR